MSDYMCCQALRMPWTWTPLRPWALQVEKTLHMHTLERQGKQQPALLRRRSLVLRAGYPRMGRRCMRQHPLAGRSRAGLPCNSL